ncbi:hypothetical protein DICPUDRAFT_98336 [Dictyostelium purpureum]|uniref:Carboxylic ester hydrolase n=1 Tax=Dictyostelium purpureum TaxID=5786 RepID=F0ZPM5_DICPU|nr:uncharacterized protein DICPUDRAFT_98336 [Dictyostelium purpureum]EGC34125.1 hypothetical protein DICPUDRAFT_98336 [Dictyostelium purpureum]|eukprot:XP_003289371.1 hypothetical protein DICPUDRAFT_98336 [Dictyostelium purpureum]
MNKIITLFLILLLVNISIAAKRRVVKTYNDPELVFTPKGAIRGIVHDTHRVFYGVPFAKPPINALRWENPVEAKDWRYIKSATQQKPECAQRCNLGDGACSEVGTSEDCLYLDVFTPRNANPESKLPVIVFIPGGAFSVGSGAVPLYDASKFANSSVIFVNTNYRLGVFGFLGTDLLSGNFGFLDQIKALEWVHNNIESFGGDKAQVTIYGQSAGSFSVATHLVSPYSKPYFQAAILSSTPLTIGLKDKSTARGFATRFANKVGCSNVEDIDCLRSKTMDEVLEAQEQVKLQLGDKILDAFTIWSPVVDGDVIPKQPLTAIKDGETHSVPTIIGDVQDEGILFVYLAFKKKVSPLLYPGYLSSMFPLTWGRVLLKYPASGTDARPALARVINDYLFRCSGRYHVNKLVAKQISESSPLVYHYQYNHVKSIGHSFEPCNGHVCHGTELSLFFNSFNMVNEDLEDVEVDLAESLNNYIVNFAKTHNPNQGDLDTPLVWEPVSKSKNRTLVIQDGFELLDKTTVDPKCDLFDSLSYRGYTKNK